MASYYDQKPWLKTYPKWLPSKLTVPDHSLLDEFLQAASTFPADPCIHYFDRTLTYKEIGEMAVALAAALADMGLGRGDRVIVVMQNIPQAVVACLAIWMRNGIVVPLNPMYTAEDLKHYLKDCGARYFICQDDIYAGQAGAADAGRARPTLSGGCARPSRGTRPVQHCGTGRRSRSSPPRRWTCWKAAGNVPLNSQG